MSTSVYDLSREWEYFDFPMELSNLVFEENLHSLTSSCKIKIWRDAEFQLTAEISGYILHPKTFEENTKEEGPGSFAQLDTITGYDSSEKHCYVLTECIVGSHKCDMLYYYEGLGVPFVASLHFQSFSKQLIDFAGSKITTQLDSFICASVQLVYSGRTQRFIDGGHRRLRVGIDEEVNIDNIHPKGLSWDFFTIDTPEIKCIVSKVPEEMKLSWANCFCIEYRSSFGKPPSDNTKEALRYFLSFLFGTELSIIGTSIFAEDILLYQIAGSPGSTTKHRCQNGSHPPIASTRQYEWGKIQYLVDNLFPNFLAQFDKLDLDSVLWRFFQATQIAVGVNLPALASALEMLANKYLSANNLMSSKCIDDEEYLSLIDEELNQIESKISHVPGYEKMLNRIKAANNRGSNEKLEFFFKSIRLPVGKIEKKSIHARNAMAHGGSGAKSKKEAKELVIKTRAYETLFHRTFLRILGYNEYYIDYYSANNKLRPITTPAGPREVEASAKKH